MITPVENLASRLAQLDDEMTKEGIPPRFRPLESFKRLYGDTADDGLRTKLFDPITFWFINRYGKDVIWDQVLGRVPVVVRGLLYLVAVPFKTQDAMIKLTDTIEDLPTAVAESFSDEEFDILGRKISASAEALAKLYRLHVDDHILEPSDKEIIRRALYDFEHTATSLKYTGDTQNAIFHSHAAAEKFLKVELSRTSGGQELRKLGHNLPNIFRHLPDAQKRFSWLADAVNFLQQHAPSMDIRYKDAHRSINDAVAVYNAALNICGTLAGIWLFDAARGSKECVFILHRFYADFARRTYRCTKLEEPDTVVLMLFGQRSGPMMEIIVRQSCSSLYLEVTQEHDLRALQAKYEFRLRNRGQLVTPEQIGLETASGPEGNYVTGVRRIRINLQNDNDPADGN